MSKTVLVIEDDEFYQKVVRRLIGEAGYEVELASNGEEGLEKTRAIKPSLIILDVMMPQVNGIEYLEMKSKEPEIADIPVIVVSNLGQQDDVDLALQKGATDYMVKAQSSVDEVAAKINQYIA